MLGVKIDLVCDACGDPLECGDVYVSDNRIYSYVKPCRRSCRRTQITQEQIDAQADRMNGETAARPAKTAGG